ncbi:DNA/RNA non-specific endonuclease [Acetobacter senegalensis]|uniref:DNA/RNA non-specific endonuclease n=1 Tax=Acetobacter senegalensis TaxID=446692 RepID=UPI0026545566|nr:DNA/RNA non-specific endonuclease [Acetobacter senegalensis]MDN7351316.1 DNA/RNA non-specific endonuclease [Acetobacter senegalensis]
MRTLLLFCILAVVPVYAVAEETNCSAFGSGNHLPELVDKQLAIGTKLLCNRGYAVLASSVSHGPLWAAEHLWSDDVETAQSLKRTGRFYQDTRVSGGSDLLDYYNSIYDRGHMAPSGDQPTEQAQAETYALTNIVPQTASLNEGIWARVERRVRSIAEKEGDLYVVTGPAFHLKPIETLGHDRVYVPSSTWKAVYLPNKRRAGAYVCRNAQQHPHCTQVTIQTLIRNTGVDPFPAVSDHIKAQAWKLPSP